MRLTLFVAAFVLVIGVGAAQAQPAPVTVDADTITYDSALQIVTAQGNVRIVSRQYRVFADAMRYDLRTEIVSATGRVRVLDAGGRELRGRTLTYNVRTEEGMLEAFEGIVDPQRRVYVRGDRLDFSPNRFISHGSLVTMCDPRRPLVSVTARRIEIVPNQEIVAHDATVRLGGRRIYGTRRFVASLRPGEEGTLVPGFGYNAVDGYWVDQRIRVLTPEAKGQVYLKYGTASGIMPLLVLTHQAPAFTTTLRLGRTQTMDETQARNLLRYDVAEVSAATTPVRIRGTPFFSSFSGTAGWYSEQFSGVSTTRLDGRVVLQSSRMSIAPALSAGAVAAFRVSSYGTGALRTVTTVGADLTYQVDPYTTATVGYLFVGVGGRTPLQIDVVDPENTVSLAMARTVPDRYRVTARMAYNAAVPETKFSGSAAVIISPSLEFGVSAVYNTRLAGFEDIDYTIRGICDCVDVVVRYRQVRREFSIEFGLIGIGERPGFFVPRSPPPPPALPGAPPGAASDHDARSH
ncbi:MAG: hypothetical protein ACT4P5_04560 [Armatimonadota bacterium]